MCGGAPAHADGRRSITLVRVPAGPGRLHPARRDAEDRAHAQIRVHLAHSGHPIVATPNTATSRAQGSPVSNRFTRMFLARPADRFRPPGQRTALDPGRTAAPGLRDTACRMNKRRFDLIVFDWDARCSTAPRSSCNASSPPAATSVLPVPPTPTPPMSSAWACTMHSARRSGLPPERYPIWATLPPPLFRAPERARAVPGTLRAADLKDRNHWLAVATQEPARLDEACRSRSCRHVRRHAHCGRNAGKPNPLMLQQLMAEFGPPCGAR